MALRKAPETSGCCAIETARNVGRCRAREMATYVALGCAIGQCCVIEMARKCWGRWGRCDMTWPTTV
eukprot:5672534-Lingulodinium_polyedra.AAC.1